VLARNLLRATDPFLKCYILLKISLVKNEKKNVDLIVLITLRFGRKFNDQFFARFRHFPEYLRIVPHAMNKDNSIILRMKQRSMSTLNKF